MDYEKKYNEALKRAEAAINIAADKDLVKGVATTIFPELRESEDERIRKWLIHEIEAIYVTDGIVKNENADKALAWLEKQKEEEGYKAIPVESTLEYKLGFKAGKESEKQKEPEWNKKPCLTCQEYEKGHKQGYTEGCTAGYNKAMKEMEQKEQKPLSTEELELNSLAFLSQMDYTCIPPKKEHQNNSDAPKNALGGALNSPLDKDKNLDDIAQDYVDGVKEYNPEPTWDLMQTAVCYGYHYREEEEQKPEEWNEEDEAMRDNILRFLQSFVGTVECESNPSLSTTIPLYMREIAWLKSLPLQLKEAYKDGFQTARHATALTFMNYLDENRPEGKMSLSNGECEDIDKAFKENDWKKIMRYANKYSWKPSEEQMDALRVTIDFMPDTFKPRCTLITLQNGLEKLI